jgi:hypothetical protein
MDEVTSERLLDTLWLHGGESIIPIDLTIC